jgi:hypothetical protein
MGHSAELAGRREWLEPTVSAGLSGPRDEQHSHSVSEKKKKRHTVALIIQEIQNPDTYGVSTALIATACAIFRGL